MCYERKQFLKNLISNIFCYFIFPFIGIEHSRKEKNFLEIQFPMLILNHFFFFFFLLQLDNGKQEYNVLLTIF